MWLYQRISASKAVSRGRAKNGRQMARPSPTEANPCLKSASKCSSNFLMRLRGYGAAASLSNDSANHPKRSSRVRSGPEDVRHDATHRRFPVAGAGDFPAGNMSRTQARCAAFEYDRLGHDAHEAPAVVAARIREAELAVRSDSECRAGSAPRRASLGRLRARQDPSRYCLRRLIRGDRRRTPASFGARTEGCLPKSLAHPCVPIPSDA